MPVLQYFDTPASAKSLELPHDSKAKFFVVFISSTDAATKQSWCPDVRRILPHVVAAFTSNDAPELAVIHVGQRPQYVVSLSLSATPCVLAPDSRSQIPGKRLIQV